MLVEPDLPGEFVVVGVVWETNDKGFRSVGWMLGAGIQRMAQTEFLTQNNQTPEWGLHHLQGQRLQTLRGFTSQLDAVRFLGTGGS